MITPEQIISDHINKESMDINSWNNLIQELEQFGKQKKISGAKSLAKLAKQTLLTQRRYFDTRSNEALRDSKKLEDQLMRAVEAVLK